MRTVCDPAFPTSWKLRCVRITNFVRTNPVEHVRRAADAGALVGRLRPGWAVHDGFAVLAESGWRGVDPGVVGDDLAADLTVLYRDNPFADTDARAPGSSPA